MKRVLLIAVFTALCIAFGIGERPTMDGMLPGVAADAGAVCLSVAVGTTSTQVIANGDLPAPGRSCVVINNSGPDVVFCQFGTNNSVTAANGFLLFIGETLPFCSQPTYQSKVATPPQNDLSCISFNGGGNTVANVQACDW